MNRAGFWRTIGSLFSVSSFTILSLVATAPATAPVPPNTEGSWRLLEPVTYENMTVFPVVSSATADTSHFITLDEGLASGEVVIREQGSGGLIRRRDGSVPPDYSTGASVNQLVLINRGKRPVLLLAGELVSGGKQDRIIGKDRIVPPGAEPLPLDVFCVEHGRWSSGGNFSASRTIVHPSVREQAAVDQDQTAVWNAVRRGTTAAAPSSAPPASLSSGVIAETIVTDAPTQSYARIYESKRVGESVDNFADEIERRFAKETSNLKGESVVGVVVAYGGEVAWSDLFPSPDLFHRYWKKLLRSYVVEALARPPLREAVSREDAAQFLSPLKGRIREEIEPGVYRWSEVNEGRLSEIQLEALQPKPLTLHRLLLRRTD